ncbi:MAG: hypothetical protein ACYDDO_09245 [Acidiferrobacterales bacterium]
MLKMFRRQIAKIAEINRKYSVPRTEISTPVRVSLLFLRVYLLFLVGLMVFKFITMIR